MGVWGAWALWSFALPNSQREQALAFVDNALGWKKWQVMNIIRNKVLPENKEKTREALIKKLKDNLESIKIAVDGKTKIGNISSSDFPAINSASSSSVSIQNTSIKYLVNNSEEIISRLEKNNQDNSAVSQAANKVLDTILPGTSNCAK